MVQEQLAVLILAAGEEVAWEIEYGTPKQLLPVGDETVLSRIIRQVRFHRHDPILITHRQDLVDPDDDIRHYTPTSRRTIADTILHTKEVWGEQTVIILGDTVFDEGTMNRLLTCRDEMVAFGNSAEIFAWSFRFTTGPHFRHTLEQVILNDDGLSWKGSPWQIYRMYCGKKANSSYFDMNTFEYTGGNTGDIDSLHEYQSMLKVFP